MLRKVESRVDETRRWKKRTRKRVRTEVAPNIVGATSIVLTSTLVDQPATEIWAIELAISAWTSGEIGAEPAEAAEAA